MMINPTCEFVLTNRYKFRLIGHLARWRLGLGKATLKLAGAGRPEDKEPRTRDTTKNQVSGFSVARVT